MWGFLLSLSHAFNMLLAWLHAFILCKAVAFFLILRDIICLTNRIYFCPPLVCQIVA